jgi:hypothetical protein
MSAQTVRRIVSVVAAGAIFATAALVIWGGSPTGEEWKAAAFFTAFGLLASGLGYKTSSATTGSIGFLPFLSIAAISPNIAAIACVAISIVGAEIAAKRTPIKALFNLSQFVFAEGLAVAAYRFSGGTALLEWPVVPLRPLAFLVMVALWLIVNKLAVSTVVGAATGVETRTHWIKSMRVSVVYDLFAFPLIFFFAVAYVRFGAVLSSALALPMLGMRQLYKTNIELQKINEELLELMVATVDAQDPYTSGHSQRVSRYAQVICEICDVPRNKTRRIVHAALLHDVGKIYVEFAPIVKKPGRLTDDEFKIMKTHSAKGAALVAKVSHFEDLVPMIMGHHEGWDGRGYPEQKAENAIPVGARIIALADTIDAMSTSRPYRDALSLETVRQEIERQSGRQFDPAMSATLLKAENWEILHKAVEKANNDWPVTVRYGIEGVVERRADAPIAA